MARSSPSGAPRRCPTIRRSSKPSKKPSPPNDPKADDLRATILRMKFTKMHGLGNDYVYVNSFTERVADVPKLARMISDRHTGIGSDGLILIQPSKVADVRMEMYNADGSRGEM